MTGRGSAGVNASPFRQKALRQPPSVPQWAMDVTFFSITRRPLTTGHISSQCIKRILVGSLLSAAGHHPPMTLAVPLPRLPQSLHPHWPGSNKMTHDERGKNAPNTQCQKQIKVQKVIFLSLCSSFWKMCLLWKMGTCANQSVPAAFISLVIWGNAVTYFITTETFEYVRVVSAWHK